MKTQHVFSSLVATIFILCVGSSAYAAPRYININFAAKNVVYQATGYSQVEYKWPKSGVVCRHNQSRLTRTCNNLKPGESYQIVDFYDHRKYTFTFPTRAPNTFNCLAGTSGNLKNVRYGLNGSNQYYINWDRKRSSSWIQLQQESPRVIVARGTGSIRTKLSPGKRYRLDDLTYGGTIYIDIKRNGC